MSRRSFPDALEMQVPGQQGTTMISFDEFEADCPRDLEQGCREPSATPSWRSVSTDYEPEHRHSTNDVNQELIVASCAVSETRIVEQRADHDHV